MLAARQPQNPIRYPEAIRTANPLLTRYFPNLPSVDGCRSIVIDQFLRLDAGSGRVQMGAAKDKLTFEKEVLNVGASSFRRGLGTTSLISGRRQCRSMRSTRPPTTRPARCRRRRRRPKPTNTTSQRLGQCSQNLRPINTGDPIDLQERVLFGGHVCRTFLAYSDVVHLRPDHFSESPSFGAMCGPPSISLAPEPRAADAH